MRWMIWFLTICILSTSVTATLDLDEEIDATTEAAFDEILEPILLIYNFIKYAASIVAALVLLFVGISYMVSGSNPAKREQAKSMAMYVVIGLVIIWVTPLVIDVLVS